MGEPSSIALEGLALAKASEAAAKLCLRACRPVGYVHILNKESKRMKQLTWQQRYGCADLSVNRAEDDTYGKLFVP
eukprot:COSAG02_NODE_631_length_19290_cov_67.062842_3_plen_76_part_00